MKKNGLLILGLTAIIGNVSAQLPSQGISSSGVLDGIYVQEHIPTKKVIPYVPLREADVIWSKRVWRTIDLKEKINHPLYYPERPISDRMALWDVIKWAALDEKSITLYDLNGLDFDDQFRYPVKPPGGNYNNEDYKEKMNNYFYFVETVDSLDENDDPVYDAVTGDPLTKKMLIPIEAKNIVKYEVKEDWFFDKQRSVLDVRIIGISPVIYRTNPVTGDIMGSQNLFWVYFPECRYVFQNFFVYNTKNDAMRMSFDDLFWKRMFGSYVHKETNVFDRGINPTWTGIDALLESERVKEDIFRFEHDLWHL
ncbi:MAG: gliding motility protein GldN [Flavobacteriales bacterium]